MFEGTFTSSKFKTYFFKKVLFLNLKFFFFLVSELQNYILGWICSNLFESYLIDYQIFFFLQSQKFFWFNPELPFRLMRHIRISASFSSVIQFQRITLLYIFILCVQLNTSLKKKFNFHFEQWAIYLIHE